MLKENILSMKNNCEKQLLFSENRVYNFFIIIIFMFIKDIKKNGFNQNQNLAV